MISCLILLLFLSSFSLQCDELCQYCSCETNRKIVNCSPQDPDVLFPIIKKSVECELQIIRFQGWSNLSLPWDLLTQAKGVQELDVRSSVLSCNCENEWLMAGNQQNYWDFSPMSHCEANGCFTARQLLNLPRLILLPPLQNCPPSLLTNTCVREEIVTEVSSVNGSVRGMCSVNGVSGCLSAGFQFIHEQINGFASRNYTLEGMEESCPKRISITLPEGSVSNSGWLRCALNNVPFPQIQMLLLLVPGKPELDGKPHVVRRPDASFRSDVKVRSYPGEPRFRWRYHKKYWDRTELWEIVPNEGKFLFSWGKDRNQHLSAGTAFEATAKFLNPGVSCNSGLYDLRVCNDYGCGDLQELLVPKNYHPEGECAEINATFWISGMEVIHDSNISTFTIPVSTSPSPSKIWKQLPYVIGGKIALLVGIGILVLSCVFRRRQKQKKRAEEEGGGEEELGEWRNNEAGPACPLLNNRNYVPWIHSMISDFGIAVVPPEELLVESSIGEGAFGKVFLVSRRSSSPSSLRFYSEIGYLYRMPCRPVKMAMKQLKFVTPDKLEDLKREASMMMNLRHPNIVAFYGITVKGDGFALLFEYMEKGDLAEHLREHNPDLVDLEKVGRRVFTEAETLNFALQAASGLEYLARHRMVHRDLAARNCLVSGQGTVKLSDFGMSREICVTNYYKMGGQTMVPLRWLPPESIIYRKFTMESDVWSFGVLLWEIFSYGQIPWCQYNNDQVLDIVKEGRILPKPNSCPEEVYETIMLGCWKIKACERPSAAELKQVLETLLEGVRGYCMIGTEEDSTVHSAEGFLPVRSPAEPDWHLQV